MTIKRGSSTTIKAIQNSIGKTVFAISRIQSYFNDQEDEDGMGDLVFTFSDQTYLTLTGVGDAESIKAFNDPAKIHAPFKVTEDDVCSWKRLDLTDDKERGILIGQKLQAARLEWNTYADLEDRIGACVLHFERAYVTFYETNSDSNRFFVNKPLPIVERPTRMEEINVL